MSRPVPESLRTRQEGPAVEATYRVASLAFTVRSPSAAIAEAVDFVYGEMRSDAPETPGIQIEIAPSDGDRELLSVSIHGRKVFEAARIGDLLHQLDNELTIAIEYAVPSLYFVHAAALADEGGVTLLVGDSGAGKSTTAYALAASGMDYLSDELAPLMPSAGRVVPYPRAFCLKKDPPAPLRVPEGSLRTEWTLHVRPRDLGCPVAPDPRPLSRIVFVRYSPDHVQPRLQPLTRADASVKLYQRALNQLAHPCFGLDETLGLVRRAECFELLAADIRGTVALLGRTL